MTKENKDLTIVEKFKEQLNTPKTQEVRYIEIEDLYPDLGYEDISSSKGYGPCFEYNCRCTREQLVRQISQLQDKLYNAPTTASFNLTIRISQARGFNFHFKDSSGNYYDYIQMWSIEDARNKLSQLQSDSLKVSNAAGATFTTPAKHKKEEVVNKLRDYIRQYERGQSVNDDVTIYN